MKMVHTYEEFCTLHDKGKIFPDVYSHLGAKSVKFLRDQGWSLDKGGWFRKIRTAEDLLDICRRSPENFQMAYGNAGIDFWIRKEK